jgi:hypothetical protein
MRPPVYEASAVTQQNDRFGVPRPSKKIKTKFLVTKDLVGWGSGKILKIGQLSLKVVKTIELAVLGVGLVRCVELPSAENGFPEPHWISHTVSSVENWWK